jgi:hypothetical protein
MNSYIKILLIIIIVFIILYFINYNIYNNEKKCDLENFNIDDAVIINRSPEYSKLINKEIDNKEFLFTKKQLDILKNKQQIYEKKGNNITNISEKIFDTCKNDLDYYNQDYTPNVYNNYSNKLTDNIIKDMENDISNTVKPNCYNTEVLNDEKYLNDYYLDVFGNNIKSDLKNYFTNYYTTINKNNDDEAIPVTTQIGKSDFLLPDQFNTEKEFTNAYNINWNRIINPLTYV